MRVRGPMAIVAVLMLGGLAPAGAQDKEKPKDLIVGKWQPADEKGRGIVLEFTKDGALKVGSKDDTIDGNYRFLDDEKVEVELTARGQTRKAVLKVKVTKNELTTVEEGKTKEERFKRVK